jgi:hypothetical protein
MDDRIKITKEIRLPYKKVICRPLGNKIFSLWKSIFDEYLKSLVPSPFYKKDEDIIFICPFCEKGHFVFGDRNETVGEVYFFCSFCKRKFMYKY